MKICVAQIRPVKGDIKRNIAHHKTLIELAVSCGADLIVFPELSITGYEPELAKELALDIKDKGLDIFQEISDRSGIIIGAGIPTRNDKGTCISMAIFQPGKSRTLYSKKYLHADEEPFFVSGENAAPLIVANNKIAFTICYELSIPEHSEHAFKAGATIYIASVAKTAGGVEKAGKSLAGIAGKYSMTVLMSNCIGHCDNFESGGKTSIWNNKGLLAAQLNDTDQGILIIDTDTEEIIERVV